MIPRLLSLLYSSENLEFCDPDIELSAYLLFYKPYGGGAYACVLSTLQHFVPLNFLDSHKPSLDLLWSYWDGFV